jgi:uncharacterized circularly permuted ATP-grasp superfamily protein
MNGAAGTRAASAAPAYEPGAALDEAFGEDGRPRELYAGLAAALAGTDLDDLRRRVDARLQHDGVTFGAGSSTRVFEVDPFPRLIGAGEWASLAPALAQRARALAAFVADAYGEQRIVAEGVMPARVIESARYFEPWVRGVAVPPEGFLAGLDLVRGSDGTLRVLEDNTRTPSGLAYAIAARRAVDAELGMAPPAGRLDVEEGCALIHDALVAAAPEGVRDPHVVMLSDGPGNYAWFEHRALADAIGIPLVTPDDLLVRGGRLHALMDGPGTRVVDVLYRRTDEDRLRDDAGRSTWIADLLLAPARRGVLSVVNPLGAGLADDKLVHAYVEEMVRFYLGEEPLLRSVHTYDLGDPPAREEALARLGDLVVKPRDGYGGDGVLLCRYASAEERRDVERRVREDPCSYVAQETISLSTHPTVVDGRLEPRHVDLRPFAVGGGEHSTVVPGALTRVAFAAGELVVNSSRNGGGKDTWVMG